MCVQGVMSKFVCMLGRGGKWSEGGQNGRRRSEDFGGRREQSEVRRGAPGRVLVCAERGGKACGVDSEQLAPGWRSWLGDGSPRTPAHKDGKKKFTDIPPPCTCHRTLSAERYLDEQRLVGGLHGLLRGLEPGLELAGLGSGLIQLAAELLQLDVEETVLGSGLFIQNPALLQLGFSLKELGLNLVSLCLEMDDLVLSEIKLSLGLVQLGFGLSALGTGLLELVLALLKFRGELLLGGAHGAGDLLRDFEELASSLLQGFQLGREGKQTGQISLYHKCTLIWGSDMNMTHLPLV